MALISWNNWVDIATLTDTSGGTDVVNARDIERIKTRQIGDVARWRFGSESPDTQFVQIQFDFGEAKPIGLLALIGHNLDSTNTVELDLGTVAGGAQIYDSPTETVWTPGDNDGSFWLYPLGAEYSSRYADIKITAFSEDVIDIGRVWLGNAWDANMAMDFSMSIVDRGTRSKSRGGSTWSSTRQKVRQINCKCWGLSDADMIGSASDFDSFLDMDQVVGDTGEIIVIPRNDNEHERHRLGVYGTMVNNGPIRVENRTSSGLFTSKTFTVEEDR